MVRWRIWTDRLIVLAIILAAWQLGSLLAGSYFLSSPWAVASRFATQLLDGLLIEHGSYTVAESLIGAEPRSTARLQRRCIGVASARCSHTSTRTWKTSSQSML